MFLSIIIPCYNEEKRILGTLDAVSEYLKKKDFEAEVIVVDNGSKDQTPHIVRHYMKQMPELKILERNSHGKGFAVRAGMVAATGDYQLFADADNSTDINQADLLIKYAQEGYDVVISSRKIEGAKITHPQPAFRVFLGNIFQTVIQLIVPVGVKDTQNGFKLFTKRASERIFRHQTVFYWAFDVQLLAIARVLGYKIKEVPIVWVNDDRSRMNFKGMARMMFEVISIRLRLWTSDYLK